MKFVFTFPIIFRTKDKIDTEKQNSFKSPYGILSCKSHRSFKRPYVDLFKERICRVRNLIYACGIDFMK